MSSQHVRMTSPLAVALALALSACGGGGSSGGTRPSDPEPIPTGPVNNLRVTIPNGAEVLVGVADSAVNTAHQEFSHGVIVATAEFIDDPNPKPNGNNHGTGVAGVIAGRYVGYSGNTKLMIAKVVNSDGQLTHRSAAAGLEWLAGAGAQVVNASFSNWLRISTRPEDGELTGYQAIAANDVVLAVAAGNSSAWNLSRAFHMGRADYELVTPPNQTGIFGAELPGLSDHTLIVGALNADGLTRWSASAFPGEDPRVQGRFLTAPTYQVGPNIAGTDTYSTSNGTSFSAPVVSAAAATLRSKWPHLNAPDTAQLLLDTADKAFSPLFQDSTCGVTGDVNCGSYYFGQGKLDLARALEPVGGLMFADADAVDGPATPVGASALRLGAGFGDAGAALAGLESAAFDAYGRDYAFKLSSLVRSHTTSRFQMGERMQAAMLRNLAMTAGERFDSGTGMRVQYDSTGAVRSAMFEHDFGTLGKLDLFSVAGAEQGVLHGLDEVDALSLMSFHRGDTVASLMPQLSGMRLSMPVAQSARVQARHWIGHGAIGTAELNGRSLSRSDLAVQFQPHASTRVSVGAGVQHEKGSAMGATAAGSLALAGSLSTRVMSFGLDVQPTQHIGLFVRHEIGRLGSTSGHSLVRSFGDGSSRESLAGVRYSAGDWQAAAVYSEPQRVSGVKAHFNLATGRTVGGQVVREQVVVDLTPSGRQRNFELAFAKRLDETASLHVNLLHVREPGHVQGATAETGAMVQWVRSF